MELCFAEQSFDATFFFNAIVSSSSDYIYLWNLETDEFIASPNMVTDFALPGCCLKGYAEEWMKKIHSCDTQRLRTMFREVETNSDTHFSLEFQLLAANNQYIWVSSKGRIKRDPLTQRATLIVSVIHNLEQVEQIDPITGLHKYEKGIEKFERIYSTKKDWFGEFLLLGLDEFNTINTLNNHNFGDMVLRTTAQDILELLPENCTMLRFEGDQFLIIGERMTTDEMQQVYNRIREYTQQNHQADGQTYRFTISAGMICYPTDGGTWSDLEKGASIALKKAKQNGKNQCVVFTHELLEERLYTQTIAYQLTESIGNDFNGFRLVFQPVCETDSMQVKGAEALLRFVSPNGTSISPLEFIPILENTCLIVPVGIWVLEQAIIACKEWTRKLPYFVMNVNVSYVQLRDLTFCNAVEELLLKYDLDVKNLTLELTESYFITDDPNINLSLQRLKKLHLQLAMDDFGTGYSSLGRLAEFNVDVIKIDRVFVQSLHLSRYNHDFVESVIRLCHNVGMKVCVEGVETHEELESVYLMNADYVQGYHVSRPIEKKAFYELFVRSPYDSASLAVSMDWEKRQKQLVSDKELLHAMMNATPLCLILWNRSCEVLACNQETVDLFGAETSEDFMENFYQFSPPFQPDGAHSSEKVFKKITEAFVTGRSNFSWLHCNRWGDPIPTEVIAVRIPYQGDYIVTSYTRDIRAQLALDEKNQKFHLRLKALLDATPLCLNLWNTKTQNIMCNQEAVTLFGLENEQEYLLRFFELSPERQPNGRLSSEMAFEKIHEAIDRGRSQFQWMHRTLKGEELPAEITLVRIEGLDDNGNDMVAGYTRDLRAQRMIEHLEHIASRRIRAAVDATPLACLFWTLEGDLIDCNSIAVKMFGVSSREELMDHFDNFFPFLQPDGSVSLKRKEELFEQVKESGRCEFPWIYVDAQRKDLPCEVTLVRAVIESGKEDIVIAYSRDLRKEAKSILSQ